MPAESLSPAVSTFIQARLSTVEELEILLCLFAARGEPRTPDSVYQSILSSKVSVERGLEKFVAAGLVRKSPGDTPAYTIDPSNNDIIQELQDSYRRLSIRVIEAIYQKPRDVVQSFADAFKLKRDP